MARSYLHTSLALLVAFVSGCGTAGHSASDVTGTPGVADPTATAKPTGDGDADGLAADQDLCPNTPAGVAVDGNGCSAAQRAQNNAMPGAANGQPGPNGQPDANVGGGANTGGGTGTSASVNGGANVQAVADGTVAPNGFAVFVLDPNGPVPITLRTLASNVENLADGGFALTGTVLIDAPNNAHITLAEAKLSL
ncbi:MAG TPA: hypothetical protein VHW01_04685, partial [Polyangiaceae bacterium]|nr:hypothetical protein [Polyangiaceae bacterium]